MPNEWSKPVLGRVYQDYAQPLTLKQFAVDADLNAAYLSALFSCIIGMPFKVLLTRVRMEKAMELLSDPQKTLTSVALAVGYSSENRFRLVFRKFTGLSPKVWRETQRREPPDQPGSI